MKTYSLKREQFIAADTEAVWNFFSNPHNLSVITPPEMNFKVLTENLPPKIYSGMIIQYSVSPLFNIKLNWTTEIKDITERVFFIDEQKKGPYLFWQHKHTFAPVEKGTQMKDEIEYALPFSYIGSIFHSLFVKNKLNNIFDFRSRVIAEKFPLHKTDLS